MNNLQTDNAPSLSVVIPPFAFGALSFLAVTVLIVLANTDLLGTYFNAKILAITHLAVLGWGTMIVFGALYQLVPVMFETALFSENLARGTTVLFAGSVILFVYSFWIADFSTILIFASSLMFISLLLFVINILMSKRDTKRNIQSRFISAAIYWLFLTALLGLFIAINFKFNLFSQVHLHYLKIHAHMGLIGWFLLLIIGVSSTLIPMFLISHQKNEKKLEVAFYLINTGLALLALDWFFLNGTILVYIYWLIISVGVSFYIANVLESFKKRMRKELDLGMKFTAISIAFLFIPIIISFFILLQLNFNHIFLLRVTTLYGFSIIFGLITPIILGQTFKTLPFIIWLFKYKQHVGKYKTPMPKELYSDNIGKIQLLTYFTAFSILCTALLLNNTSLITIGSYLMLITALLYNINVFKIILHKTKTERFNP